MRNGKNGVLWLALLFAIAAPSSFAQRAAPAAKDYPARVIRIVVPYGAGAGPDVVGRIPMNGAPAPRSGTPADGYTLLLQVASYASYPFFFRRARRART